MTTNYEGKKLPVNIHSFYFEFHRYYSFDLVYIYNILQLGSHQRNLIIIPGFMLPRWNNYGFDNLHPYLFFYLLLGTR